MSIFTSAADLKEIVGKKIRVNGGRQEVVKVSWKSKQVKFDCGTVVSADDIVRRGRGFAVADSPAKPAKKAAKSAKKVETETKVVRGRNRKQAKEETKAVNKKKATKPKAKSEPKIEEKAMSKSIFNSAADLKEIVGKPLTVNGEKRDEDNKRIRVAAVSWKKQQVKLTDGDVVSVSDIYRKGAGFFADTEEVAAKPGKKAAKKATKPTETPELFASAKELKELVGKPLTVNGEKRDEDNRRIRVAAVSWNKQQVKLTDGDVIAVEDIYKKGVGFFADTEEETEKVRKKADKPAAKSEKKAAKPKRKQVEEDLDEDLDDDPVRIPRGGKKVRKKAEKAKVRKSKKESPEDMIGEAIEGIVDLADEWIPRGFKLAANGAEFNKDGLVVVHLSLVPSKMKAAEVEALLNSYSEAEKEDELEEYADEFEEDVDLIDEDELEEDFDEEDEDDLEDEDEDEDDEDDLEDEDEDEDDEDDLEDEDEDEDDEDEDEDDEDDLEDEDEDEFDDEDDFDI